MNKIKNNLLFVKDHVHRNRGKYAAVATAATCYAISRRSVNEWNAFLEEKGLTTEFYTPEMLES